MLLWRASETASDEREVGGTKREAQLRIRAAILVGRVHTADEYGCRSSGETQSWFSSHAEGKKKENSTTRVATSTNERDSLVCLKWDCVRYLTSLGRQTEETMQCNANLYQIIS